jgi:hypothetical protein
MRLIANNQKAAFHDVKNNETNGKLIFFRLGTKVTKDGSSLDFYAKCTNKKAALYSKNNVPIRAMVSDGSKPS